MIQLDRKDYQALIDLLTSIPEMRSHSLLQHSLKEAGLNEFVAKINFSGDTYIAVRSIVNYLLKYGRIESGEFALEVFLRNLKQQKYLEASQNKLLDRLLKIYDLDRLQFNGRSPYKKDLLKQVNCEVIGRLKQLLVQRSYLILDKIEDRNKVNYWGANDDVTIINLPPRKLASQTSIIKIYDRVNINGRLLILGSTGSGTTTTLLQLTRILIDRAYSNSLHPIPILLNLSSWHEERQEIDSWLVEDLKLKYGVSKSLGKKLLQNRAIIPLLDGLDEVKVSRQKLCVQKINQFLNSYSRVAKIVVCCRIEAYQKTGELLKLNNSIVLEPLREEQIQEYLLKVSRGLVWKNIKTDRDLLELIKTPLILNIWLESRQKILRSQWQNLSDRDQKISYLLDIYIKSILARPLANTSDLKNTKFRFLFKQSEPKPQVAIDWLSYLSVQLIDKSETEFLKDKIQSYWLSPKNKKFIYGLICGVIIGLIIMLIIGVIVRIVIALIIGSLVGLIYALTGGLRVKTLQKTVDIKPRKLLIVIIKELIAGESLGGLIVGIIVGIIIGTIVGLVGKGAIVGTIAGLVGRPVEEWIVNLKIKKVPIKKYLNLNFRKIAKKIIKLSSISSLFLTLLLLLIVRIFPGLVDYIDPVRFNRLIQSFEAIAITGFIWLSAFRVIQKSTIRIVLWLSGCAPWNYIGFIESCCDRGIIQRVAGGYRFSHRLLQEHFATIWYERERPIVSEKKVQ